MEATAALALLAPLSERRAVRRNSGQRDVWLVNHFGRTILRCTCIDSTAAGMRLHVPPGYGIGAGQRYEICEHASGNATAPPLHEVGRHWGTIIWSRRCREHGAAFVDVGILLEAPHACSSGFRPRLSPVGALLEQPQLATTSAPASESSPSAPAADPS